MTSGGLRQRDFSPEVRRATGSRPNSGRICIVFGKYFFQFSRVAAAASRAKHKNLRTSVAKHAIATELPLRHNGVSSFPIGLLAAAGTQIFGEKKVSRLVRDPMARGSSGLKPLRRRAPNRCPLACEGENVVSGLWAWRRRGFSPELPRATGSRPDLKTARGSSGLKPLLLHAPVQIALYMTIPVVHALLAFSTPN